MKNATAKDPGHGNATGDSAIERRHQIANVAAELFDERGYYQTSMEELAREVGIAKPTLYHYFGSKDEILFRIHQEFIGHLIDLQQDQVRANMPPADQVRSIMRDLLDLMERKRGHVRVFFEHWRELPKPDRDIVKTQRDHYEALVEQAVRSSIENGSFRSLDARLVTLGIFGMCNWAYQWYRIGGTRTSREIADFFFNMLFDGVGADSVGLDTSGSPS